MEGEAGSANECDDTALRILRKFRREDRFSQVGMLSTNTKSKKVCLWGVSSGRQAGVKLKTPLFHPMHRPQRQTGEWKLDTVSRIRCVFEQI